MLPNLVPTDALELEAGAKHRLADEYDAAQERGEIRSNGERSFSSPEKVSGTDAVEPKLLHEARLVRDAEEADPGIERSYEDISDKTEEEMHKMVASLNQHRRARTTPLSNAEKTARVEAELKRDPARSDRAIAEAAGVKSHELVGRIRHRVALDATPSERKSTNGKVGEGQRQPRGSSVEQLRGKRRSIEDAIQQKPQQALRSEGVVTVNTPAGIVRRVIDERLERDEQVAEWIRITERINASQVAAHRKPGQQPGGVNAASRELGIDATDAHRAVKVASSSDEAKQADALEIEAGAKRRIAAGEIIRAADVKKQSLPGYQPTANQRPTATSASPMRRIATSPTSSTCFGPPPVMANSAKRTGQGGMSWITCPLFCCRDRTRAPATSARAGRDDVRENF